MKKQTGPPIDNKMAEIIGREFYARRPEIVARQLLGKLLVSTTGEKRTSGIIVETEAYLASSDSACHGHHGQTRKNATMFGPAGRCYVYSIHAKFCFNVVTEAMGRPSAVLIRALQPIENLSQMRIRRNRSLIGDLCSGPAKLCQALGVDRSIDDSCVSGQDQLWIEDYLLEKLKIKRTRRIGVTSAKNLKLRFVIAGSPYASGPKYLR